MTGGQGAEAATTDRRAAGGPLAGGPFAESDFDLSGLDDAVLAAELATRAGWLLLGIRAELAGADPRVLRDAGDARSHDFLLAALTASRPADAVLSEEGRDDLARLASDRVWIVDPLDGTREFGEPGRSDWAVHVALWERGELVAGAVALPAERRTFASAPAPAVARPYGGPPRLVVSRTRAPKLVEAVRDRLGGELVAMGSAGAKTMSVVQGAADIYLHAGGQYEWDSAAPVAVARAAGLHTSRLDGSPLVYNSRDPLLPDLLVCRPELADAVLEVLHSLGSAAELDAASAIVRSAENGRRPADS
jgi:3'(2'), 5'-bisphosphate nucleotidase